MLSYKGKYIKSQEILAKENPRTLLNTTLKFKQAGLVLALAVVPRVCWVRHGKAMKEEMMCFEIRRKHRLRWHRERLLAFSVQNRRG